MNVWLFLLGVWLGGVALLVAVLLWGVPDMEWGIVKEVRLYDKRTGRPMAWYLIAFMVLVWPLMVVVALLENHRP